MKKLFILFVLLPFFSFKVTTTEEDLFFGDSITFGNELGALQYTARWSTQYCTAAPTTEINESRSGASMAPNPYGRPVFNINDVPVYQPTNKHIFVSYWVNDFTYGTTPVAFAAATSIAVDGIIAKGWPASKIVLCFNYLPEAGLNWPYTTHTVALQWLAALRSVKQAKGTSFLDFYTLIYNRPDKATYSGDYIHPTAAWNTIMKQYALTNIEGPTGSLPATIINFSGQRQGSSNSITWTVAQEQNVLQYEIERSENGTNWIRFGTVNSAGQSAAQRSYSFIDNNNVAGKQLYRLRTVDKNGTSKLSSIISISGGKASVLAVSGLFPNPAVSKLNVLVDAPAKNNITLYVTDALGRTVKMQKQSVEAGTNNIDVNTSALQAGTYWIRIMNNKNEVSATAKFLK